MSKYAKGLVRAEVEKRIAENDIKDFVVVSIKGISGVDNNLMRGELKQKGVGLLVVKNSMFKKIMQDSDMEPAAELFTGTCCIAYGGDSIVDVAKEIEQCAKKAKTLKVKGAFVDGVVMGTDAATALAKMPNRAELQGEIVILAISPGTNLAGAIVGPGSVIVGCIESLVENLEKEAA